jgi:3-dehydroquinate synthetase
MDMANFVAVRLKFTEEHVYERMHNTLRKNFAAFEKTAISTEYFFSAISKDKKNSDDKLCLIMPDRSGKIVSHLYPNDTFFQKICSDYIAYGRLV